MDKIAGNQERLFSDYVHRLSAKHEGRRAVHLHLSRLNSRYRQDHHVRIAASCFSKLIAMYNGHLFSMTDGDIVFICQGAPIHEMEDVVNRLRYLFADDPLVRKAIEASDEDDAFGDLTVEEAEQRFATWYDLERDWQSFAELGDRYQAVSFDLQMEELNKEFGPKKPARQNHGILQEPGQNWKEAPGDTQQSLTPEILAKLEYHLRNMDLSNLVRTQRVCALARKSEPHPVFGEMFVSIGDLTRLVIPNVDLSSNRWLFQYMTSVLDRRMLLLLPTMEEQLMAMSASVNINVETLLSKRFLDFDARLREATRKTIVFELQPVDIFSDMAAFMFARDFVQDRGYRILLDGLTNLTLPLIDRHRLGVDLVKLYWQPDMSPSMSKGRFDELKKSVEDCNPERVILSRVETEEAVEFGFSLGIGLFQGRYVDALLTGKRQRDAERAREDRRERMRTVSIDAVTDKAKRDPLFGGKKKGKGDPTKILG